MKAHKSVSEWDDTPISEQTLVCPVCKRHGVEMKPMKIHLWRSHDVKLEDSLLTEDDFRRHLDNVNEQ